MATQNAKLVQVTKDEHGDELVMVRVDKTMKVMMEERHFDPQYYHPNTEKILNALEAGKFQIKSLGDFIGDGPQYITYGQVGKRLIVANSEVRYVTTKNIIETGLDLVSVAKFTPKDDWNDPVRSRPKKNDILFIGNGVGCAGRVIWLFFQPPRSNIEQNIVILRPDSNIYRGYVAVYLKSIYGITQIFRVKDRVGAAYINFDEIKAIKIPLIPSGVQQNIESEYKRMSAFHDKAMLSKQKGNDSEYQKNITIAETMLRELIAKTEAVIRGEREDVV